MLNNSSYSDEQHRKNTKNINNLLNTSKFETCRDWYKVSSIFKDAKIKKTCTKCNGTGKVPGQTCTSCKGRGMVRCQNYTNFSREKKKDVWGYTTSPALDINIYCRGGKITYSNSSVEPSIYYDEVCYACNGSGLVDCGICNGYGKIDKCPDCNRKGYKEYNYLNYYK